MEHFYVHSETKENGEIVYTKCDLNLSNYDFSNNQNQIILTPKINTHTINSIQQIKSIKNNFKYSEIISCMIKNMRPKKNNYPSILVEIYKKIGDGAKIIKNTIIKCHTIEKKKTVYIKDLGISVNCYEAFHCFKEILAQCFLNKIKFNIQIKLNNGVIENYLVDNN